MPHTTLTLQHAIGIIRTAQNQAVKGVIEDAARKYHAARTPEEKSQIQQSLTKNSGFWNWAYQSAERMVTGRQD